MANKYIANTRITILSIGQVVERGDEFPANLPEVDYDNLIKEKLIVYGKSLRNSTPKRDSKGVQGQAVNGDVDAGDGDNG